MKKGVVSVFVSLIIAFTGLEIFYIVLCNNATLLLKMPDPIISHIRTVFWHSPYRRYVQFDPACAEFDPEIFYRLKPSGSCVQETSEFKVRYDNNSAGVRDDEESLVSPEIIALGDSQAMGWGVHKEDRFTEFLERATGKKVLNVAVSSWGPARELLMLKRLDLSNVKTIIFQHASNDAYESEAYLQNTELFHKTRNEKEWSTRSQFDDEKSQYFFGKNVYLLITQLWRLYNDGFHQLKISEKEGEHFLQILKMLKPQTSNDIHYIIFSVNVKRTFHSKFIERLNKAYEHPEFQKEFPHFDTLNITEELNQDQYRFVIDNHLTRKGHEFVASKILPILKN